MTTANSISLLRWLVAGVLIAGCSQKEERDHVEYTKPDGKMTSDVRSIENGTAAYQVVGGAAIPAKAKDLHRQARAKGEAGDYKSALTLLKQASEIAPGWPYPPYDMAFTYLLQGDPTNALLSYREADRLEPRGFFTTKTAVWALDREERGVFPRGTYLAYVSLEWAEPEKKSAMVDRMTTNLPAFAPAWKERALLTEPADQRLGLFEKALSLDPDPETHGICVLNKAAILNSSGRAAEARQMLEDLARSDTSTLSTKALANEMLKLLKK